MNSKTPRSDARLIVALRAAAILASSIILLIMLFLIRESFPALRDLGGLRFITDEGWYPAAPEGQRQFNLVPMLLATLFSTIGAILLAAPAGVLSAVFCQYYASPRVAALYRRVVELLAGIPSVIYGFWGLVTLVPILQQLAPPGQNLLAGILILSLMILPTVAMLANAAFEAVPPAYVNGAVALGLSRWTTVRGIVVPAAAPGLLIAIVLGTMRAVGETMAVLMVCGNVVKTPTSLFSPVRTLTANIALEMGYATEAHRSVLFVSGLALMIIVTGLILLQRHIKRRLGLAGA